MEQRKGISLVGLLLRYAMFCIISVIGVILIWWISLTLALSSGFIMPANVGEKAAQMTAQKLQEKGEFDETLIPDLCDYVFWGKDDTVIASSLRKNERDMKEAIIFKEEGYNSTSRYHLLVELKDGICILQYNFKLPYTSKNLSRVLPDFQLLSIGISCILLVIILMVITGHYAKVLKCQLEILKKATVQIKEGDLETVFEQTQIKEYDAVLEAMEGLKSALKKSLLKEWYLEHSLITQTVALAHDLKTPLTVIDGNGQFLQETELNLEQRECLEAIMRNVKNAKEYVDTLNDLSRVRELGQIQKEKIEGKILVEKITQTAKEICKIYHKQVEINCDELPTLYLMPREVLRAIANVIENAAHYSEADLPIKVGVKWESPYIRIIVEDCGKGFSKQALENGKKLFYTENISRSPKGHRGIGLAFAENIVSQHQGELILANNELGNGKVTLKLKGEL